MPRPLSPAVLAAALACLAAAAPAAADDVAVQAIQVTQGIQNVQHTIPLVADRGTAIRALITSDQQGQASSVTGRAHVTVDGVRVTPQFGLAPVNGPVTPVLFPNFDNEANSLVFELPAPTGIAPREARYATSNVQVRVDVSGTQDTNPANNSAERTGLRVESKATPIIFFKRINWLGNPPPTQAGIDLIQPGRGDAYLRAALPIDDSDPASLYRGGLPDHRFDLDLPPALFVAPNRLLDAFAAGGPPEGDKLIVDLEVDRYVLAGSRLLDPFRLFLWGWVGDGETFNHDGLGAVGAAQAAYSVDDPATGPCSLTHEAIHNIGREHNASTISISPANGFDVGARLLGNPSANGVTGRLWPSSTQEIMDGNVNACTTGAWVGETNYRAFLDKMPDVPSRLLGNREPNPKTGIPLLPRRRCRTNLANLFGRVASFDAPTGRVRRVADLTVWRAGWCNAGNRARAVELLSRASASRAPAARGLLARLSVRTAKDRVRTFQVPIDAEVSVIQRKRPHRHGLGPFRVEAPVAGRLERAQVYFDGRRLADLRPSRTRPALAIAAPRAKGTLTGRSTIRWAARDADRGARLRFLVAYSPDRGRHWYPLGSNLTGRSLRVDARQLVSSRDGWVRVVASDGVNTVQRTATGVLVRAR